MIDWLIDRWMIDWLIDRLRGMEANQVVTPEVVLHEKKQTGVHVFWLLPLPLRFQQFSPPHSKPPAQCLQGTISTFLFSIVSLKTCLT